MRNVMNGYGIGYLRGVHTHSLVCIGKLAGARLEAQSFHSGNSTIIRGP